MYKIWKNKVNAIIKKRKKDYFNGAIQSKTDWKKKKNGKIFNELRQMKRTLMNYLIISSLMI